MQIRILGFEWNVSPGLPLNAFYNSLTALSDQQQKTLSSMLASGVSSVPAGQRPDKIICVDRKGALWRGMFIKIRNARSFMTISSNSSILSLTSEELEQNKAMAEVNFFVLNEITGRGLYQFYHQSTHLDGFCAYCGLEYNKQLKVAEEELVQQANDGAISEVELIEARSRLSKPLTYSVMVRREKLPLLLAELERINSVELVLSSTHVSKSAYKPMAEESIRQIERFVFGRQSAKRRDRIKKSVINAVASISREKKASIVGMLPGNIKRVLDLEDNYDVLGELDYDSTAKDLKIDFSNLQQSLAESAFISRLSAIAERPDVKARLEAPRQ